MNSLDNPKISSRLAELHELAQGDGERWRQRRKAQQLQPQSTAVDSLIRLGDFYIPVSPAEGQLLYLLARAKNAQHIVEFGASYGVSTLYLAAAARDNGGQLVTTEVHPQKCSALRETFAAAGVDREVTLLEGDAEQTLKSLSRPVEILFLDGWKSLYLPIFEMLRPLLPSGALIAADNVNFAETKPYLERVQAPGSGLLTQFIDDLALTCVL